MQKQPEHVDVVIVGAGLSGIGAAYRLQTECPGRTYTILESRHTIGGTWDLFRYPGVRSDSDMFTLSYPFKPWSDAKAIADGPAILDYIRETAAEFGIDRRIRFGTRVVGADWSSRDARWTLTVEEARAADGEAGDGTEPEDRSAEPGGRFAAPAPVRRTITCEFLYACAGYYDYERGHSPEFAGIEDYAGTVVHPQFWPEDLAYTDRRVVVIGSGATAVTLVPAMARDAAHITMLQRSPTWISPIPGRDRIADAVRAVLPAKPAHQVARMKNVLFTLGFYQFCRRRPEAARRLITKLNSRVLQDDRAIEEHFTPTYDPWDQRLCAAPDADFFKAVRSGKASVVTDHVETFVPEGVRLKSGRVLEADIVVTATGLQLRVFGGIVPHVDGEPVPLSEQFVWRGLMLTGVPNFAACIGYTNASWTLRADLSSRLVCKVLDHMARHDYAAVEPRPDGRLTPRPLLDLASGYIQRSIDAFPHQGDRSPWLVRQNYLIDAATTMRTNLHKTLAPTPRAAVRAAARAANQTQPASATTDSRS